MTRLNELPEPATPSEDESNLALDSSRRLAALLERPSVDSENGVPPVVTLHVANSNDTAAECVSLPPSALPLLAQMMAELGQGHAVALLPIEAELTTQQAADLLNVSRPFLVGLLEQRQIPARKVGKHRRVLLRDVLAFKRRNEADRLEVLAELQAQAQELDMGY